MRQDQMDLITANIETVLAPFRQGMRYGYMGQVWDRIADLTLDIEDEIDINTMLLCVSGITDLDLRKRMRARLHVLLDETLNWHCDEAEVTASDEERGMIVP